MAAKQIIIALALVASPVAAVIPQHDFLVTVQLKSSTEKVIIRASNATAARELAVLQYGKERVKSVSRIWAKKSLTH